MQSKQHWLLDQFEEVIASLAVVVIVFSVSWGVITRYITEQSAAWASELATLGFAWLVFFGAAACIKYHLHPSIDMLSVRLTPTGQRLLRYLNDALVLGFCLFMAGYGTLFAIDAWGNPSPVMRLPLSWLYGPVALCFALMAIRKVQVMAGRVWTL